MSKESEKVEKGEPGSPCKTWEPLEGPELILSDIVIHLCIMGEVHSHHCVELGGAKGRLVQEKTGIRAERQFNVEAAATNQAKGVSQVETE